MKTNHTKETNSRHKPNGNTIKLKMVELVDGYMINWTDISTTEWYMARHNTCGLMQYIWLDTTHMIVHSFHDQTWHPRSYAVHMIGHNTCGRT